MRDVTDSLLQALSEDAIAEVLIEHRKAMRASVHPQAMLMFAKLAAHHTGEIGRQRDDFYDFAHAMNFKALAACLTRYVDPNTPSSFEEPLRPDEDVRRLFARQFMEETNLHQAACMRNGLRRAFYDPATDAFELRLTKRRRRSALTLVDRPAQMELLDDATGGRLQDEGASLDDIMFAFASGAEQLRFVQDAHPASWAAFEAAACTAEELATYTAFLSFLEFAAQEVGHSLLYSRAQLLKLGKVFLAGFPDHALGGERLMRLMALFSLTPAEADRLLLPVPFFRVGDRYLRYEGFSQIMSPTMGLLTIAVRKHEKAWNDSVGSTLAYAADAIAETLPKFDHLAVAVRRRLKSKGDIDLALYDTASGHLLLCEVKTVYDKHQTVLHMHRFEEAKVKLGHAVNQLRGAIASVASGAVTIQALFGRKLPPPRRVSGALLTWFDAVDLTIGTPDEDVLSLNFATLRYFVHRAAGSIDAVHRAAHELRNIWCVSERRLIDLQTKVPAWIEAQLPALDSPVDIARLGLSDLAQAEVDTMPSLPNGWREAKDSADTIVSYLEETLERLCPAKSDPGTD
jgi:hypothetical protein